MVAGLMRSALYEGAVVHRRSTPRVHRLRYDVPFLLLDLDELATAGTGLFSVNRGNLFSFHERDHGDGQARGLRAWVDRTLARAGIDERPAHVGVLAMPSVLGRVFNPLTVYFCDRADGTPIGILYEVNNTFGGRHTYALPVAGDVAAGGVVRQRCDKAFYVSPFLPPELEYRFRVRLPAEGVSVSIVALEGGCEVLSANFVGRRTRISTLVLLRLFARHGIIAFKVFGGIHLEAFKLWRKRIPMHARPLATPLQAR